jgi:hypothetical protein
MLRIRVSQSISQFKVLKKDKNCAGQHAVEDRIRFTVQVTESMVHINTTSESTKVRDQS